MGKLMTLLKGVLLVIFVVIEFRLLCDVVVNLSVYNIVKYVIGSFVIGMTTINYLLVIFLDDTTTNETVAAA